MLQIFIAHALFLPSLIGLGLLICSLLGIQGKGRPVMLGEAGFIGILGVISLATVINLFVPISLPIRTTALGLGWVGLVLCRKFVRMSWVTAGFMLVTLLLSSIECHFSVLDYDVGLYYMPIVKWMHSEPVAFGLGNIYLWLGHNLLWFALHAMLDQPLLGLASQYIANSLLFCLLFLSAIEILDSPNEFWRAHPFSIFCLLAALGVFFFIGGPVGLGAKAASINNALATVVFYISFLQVQILINPQDRTSILLCGLLSLLGLIMKSNGVFPLLITVLILGKIWLGGEIPDVKLSFDACKKILFSRMSLAVAIIILPWMIRGIITSGCYLYPARISCFPSISWSVSDAQVEFLNWAVKSGVYQTPSRSVEIVKQFALEKWKEQFPSKLIRAAKIVQPLLIFAVILLMFGWVSRGRLTYFQGNNWMSLKWLLPAEFIVVLTSLFLAPRVRYCFTNILMIGVILAAFVMSRYKPYLFLIRRDVNRYLLIGLLAYSAFNMRFLVKHHEGLLDPWPRIPLKGSYTQHADARGNPYYVPFVREGIADISCWDFPVPCTPLPMNDISIEERYGRKAFILKNKSAIRHEGFYARKEKLGDQSSN